jgi:hypothetical protein
MSALYATIIYGLVDPRNQELRYVGKTIQPLENRLRLHIGDARKIKRRHVCSWIKQLMANGLEPEIFEIDRAGDDWSEREQFWIAYFRYIGSRLTNQTVGGEGVPGRAVSPETRIKMQGRTQTVEARLKISEAVKRQHADPEKKAKLIKGIRNAFTRPEVIAKSNAARIRPDVMAKRVASIKATFEAEPERLEKRATAIRAAWLNPDTRARASESHRRRHAERPFPAETRAKLSAAFKGRVFSEETRKKMSESAKRRQERERAEKASLTTSEDTKWTTLSTLPR